MNRKGRPSENGRKQEENNMMMKMKNWFGKKASKEQGIDGLLVTVGLCIIALLLCVVMKDKLQVFIETIVASLTTKAINILG